MNNVVVSDPPGIKDIMNSVVVSDTRQANKIKTEGAHALAMS